MCLAPYFIKKRTPLRTVWFKTLSTCTLGLRKLYSFSSDCEHFLSNPSYKNQNEKYHSIVALVRKLMGSG